MPHSLVVVSADDADFPIIYANQSFELLTGYSLEETIGRNCRFLGGPGTSIEVRAEIRAALAGRRPYAGRILNYRKDGSAFWNQLTLTPVADENGACFIIGVQEDITERLEFEARLRESQRMEALGKLSGGIAHDFNNFLALILGNAEIIASEADSKSLIGEAAADIIEAAEGGSNLIARLLQYSRGERGRVEDVSINAVIEDVIALVSRTTRQPVQFQTDLSAAVGNVRVDATLLSTCLLNLLLNARDAIEGAGTIQIETRRRANAGPALTTVAVVTVTDDGTGMDAATLARAFEPFFTTKEPGRGNGLGLAMVYNFVKQSGGDISIESRPGERTTVTMLLPLAEETARAPGLGETQPHILLVEDDAKVRKMIALHLKRKGFAIEEAASAEEALRLVVEEGLRPALLLSDIRLRGGMSGVELVLELRRSGEAMGMMLMTGYADELDRHGHLLTDVPVLRKPFRVADLIEMAERAILRARA